MNESDDDIIRDIEAQNAGGRELEGAQRIPGTVSKNLTVTYTLRMTPQEYSTFNAAAKARGMKLADFTRAALHAAIAGEINPEQVAAMAEMRELISRMTSLAGQLPEQAQAS
jgi:cytidylate kinase